MHKKSSEVSLFIISILIIGVIGKVLSSEIINITTDMEYMYIYYFAYSFIGEKITIINIIFASIPTIVNLGIFSTYVDNELNKNAQYIFTRSKKRTAWLIKELMKLARDIILVNGVQFIIALMIFSILGFDKLDIIMVIKLYVLVVLNQYLIILVSNIVCLGIGNSYGFIVSVILYLISILIMNIKFFAKKSAIKYIPFIQNMLSIHSDINCDRSIPIMSNYIENFSIYESIFYVVFLIIVFIIIGINIVKNKEIF